MNKGWKRYCVAAGGLILVSALFAKSGVSTQQKTRLLLEQAEKQMKARSAQRTLRRMLDEAESMLRRGELRRKILLMQQAIGRSSNKVNPAGHSFNGISVREDLRRMDLNKLLAQKDSAAQPSRHRYRLLVFVSFSMPVSSLKALYEDADRIGAPLLLRGLVNNRLRDTALAMRSVLDIQKGAKVAGKTQRRRAGFLVDPNSFKRLKISRVPAFVYLRNGELQLKCGRPDRCAKSSIDYDVVYGDITLRKAIERIAHRQEDKWLKTYLQRLSDRF